MSNASVPPNLTVKRTPSSRVLVTCKPTFDALSETSATSGCVTTSADLSAGSTEHASALSLVGLLHPVSTNVVTAAASIRFTCTASVRRYSLDVTPGTSGSEAVVTATPAPGGAFPSGDLIVRGRSHRRVRVAAGRKGGLHQPPNKVRRGQPEYLRAGSTLAPARQRPNGWWALRITDEDLATYPERNCPACSWPVPRATPEVASTTHADGTLRGPRSEAHGRSGPLRR
jgi:hypothetical protein